MPIQETKVVYLDNFQDPRNNGWYLGLYKNNEKHPAIITGPYKDEAAATEVMEANAREVPSVPG